MQLVVDERKLTTRGVRDAQEYGIEISAHMMSMLSRLYSDPIWAVVREYAANMLDGYARLDPLAERRPPEITLPSRLAPHIEFKDYGCGMSEEVVREVFRMYGSTTKRGDDVEVGGFGIGSKAAFAYAPATQWTVESRFGGEKLVFNVTKNERGVPTLMHIVTVATEEPNGVTIRIPVAPNDFAHFRDAVRRLATYYPMPLVVQGDSQYAAPALAYAVRGESWGVRAGPPQRNSAGATMQTSNCVVGGIPYPLVLTTETAGPAVLDLQDLVFDLYLSIGSVDITPSREALEYTPRTKAALAAAVAQLPDDLARLATEHVADAPTEWEAMTRLHAAFGVRGLRRFVTSATWRGKTVGPSYSLSMEDLTAAVPGVVVEQYTQQGKAQSVRATKQPDERITLRADRAQWLFVDDLTRPAVSRVRTFFSAQCKSDLYGKKEWAKDGVIFVVRAPGLTADVLSALLAGHPVEGTTSQLPEPVRVRRDRKKTQVKRLTSYDEWDDVEIEDDEGGFYVPLERGDVMHPTVRTPALALLRDLAVERGVLTEDDVLYGIPRTCKALEEEDGWENFLDAVTAAATAEVTQFGQALANERTWAAVYGTPLGHYLVHADLTRVPPASRLYAVVQAAQSAAAAKRRAETAAAIARAMQVPVPDVPATENGEGLVKMLRATYPMLDALAQVAQGSYHRDALVGVHGSICEYVRGVGV